MNQRNQTDVPSGSPPAVFIIILNYNGWADTVECLESVLRIDYPQFHAVLVDNGSSDNSRTFIQLWAEGKLDVYTPPRHPLRRLSHPPIAKPVPIRIIPPGEAIRRTAEISPAGGISLIASPDNLGFAGGNNLGIQYAVACGADYVLLLNNDTVVKPDFLTHLIGAAQRDSALGIAGGTIYYYDEPEKIWAMGGGRLRAFTSAAGHIGAGKIVPQIAGPPQAIDYVTGCLFLIKSGVIQKIGLMDEKYFLYYEETDWCWRAKAAGFHCVHVPGAIVYHKAASGMGEPTPRITYYYTRNRIYFVQKNFTGLNRIITLLYLKWLNRLRILRHFLRGRTDRVQAIQLAIQHARQGIMGIFTPK